jgi:enamine deaminase RidA (YjgF/YER057c/UK114 family)
MFTVVQRSNESISPLSVSPIGATRYSTASVVRLRFFVTRWTPEMMGDFLAGVELVAEELGLPQPMPPASLIGVEILFEEDVLVELEAYAVLD